MRIVQGSGPLRRGDIPPWHKRATVRAEKRRLLAALEKDSIHNKRDNNRIRLGEDQKVHIPAIVLVECFTPSNIKNLFASIDTWPIKPPEYLDSLKDEVGKWRNSAHSGAWRHIALLARPDCGMLMYSADPTLPENVKAVDLFLLSSVPSLTCVVAVFHPTDDFSDVSARLREYFVPRTTASLRAKGKIARFTHALPWSRAKNVHYNVVISKAEQLQRESMENMFSELEADCWQWFGRRALGKVGVLPLHRRPSLRCVLLDNLEPFGPIEPDESKHAESELDGGDFNRWFGSQSEEPYGRRIGPLEALELNSPSGVWTSKDRDAFYFSTPNRYNEARPVAYLSANRAAVTKIPGIEDDFTGFSIFNYLIQTFSLGLISAWTVEQLLSRYTEEIANIRDSSASTQSVYRVAEKLNDFLVRDGHDAAVISRDAIRVAALDYSFGDVPPFETLIDIRRTPAGREKSASDLMAKSVRNHVAASAKFVSTELEMATTSISTSATLLQSMSEIRLQRWSVGLSLVAIVIAVLAIFLS